MPAGYVTLGGLHVRHELADAVSKHIAPAAGIAPEAFWTGFASIIKDMAPKNGAFMRTRDAMQAQIDAWLMERTGQPWDAAAYKAMLIKIGYLIPEGPAFACSTKDVDTSIMVPLLLSPPPSSLLSPLRSHLLLSLLSSMHSSLPLISPLLSLLSSPFSIGTLIDYSCSALVYPHRPPQTAAPQLVCPVDNARFALNAANARWGSLLDAYYGTTAGPDPALPGMEKGKEYNPVRGAAVFKLAQSFLDEAVPLAAGKYDDVVNYALVDGKLSCTMADGSKTGLKEEAKFVGYRTASAAGAGHVAASGALTHIVLKNNGLHIELAISKKGPGATHPASVSDIQVESALSVIMDCEDSVAAVDGADKAHVYLNWSGLNQATLTANLGGDKVRTLNPDRVYTAAAAEGGDLSLPGRALMLVRNVGLHVYTDAVLTPGGQQIPESMLDLAVLALGSVPDLKQTTPLRNSYQKSMYVVRPKMHGPEEVKFVVEMFGRVEQLLGLPALSLKMGIMDEERRTTVNLYECIRVAQDRVIFINTGFLDRTGDEIHTSFEAGAMLPKSGIKVATWRTAYEDWNVDVGIAAGMLGVAQIGKGMWAKPDALGEMLVEKAAHPRSGATCGWVPSPTAATLHATHYHQTNVIEVQKKLAAGGRRATVDDILQPPLLGAAELTPGEIKREIENNAQGILGYVVRWVQQGVGCSKVPDVNDVGLMEDRATLRIASQAIANWIYHGLISEEDTVTIMKSMATVVDRQNASDKAYRPMAPDFNNNAWKGAMELVMNGRACPNGYTESALMKWRKSDKESPATVA
jgi:malate synthase